MKTQDTYNVMVELTDRLTNMNAPPVGSIGHVIAEGSTGTMVQVDFSSNEDLDFVGGRFWVKKGQMRSALSAEGKQP